MDICYRASTKAIPLALQAFGLLIFAMLLGLLWNFFSPSSIKYDFNYFPLVADKAQTTLNRKLNDELTSAAAPKNWQGKKVISQAGLINLLSHKSNNTQRVTLIDARKETLYNKGHICGAFKFDRYRFTRDLPIVLPVCLKADLVVIYCQGGKCDDSHIAKKILIQSGVPQNLIVILEGGISGWVSSNHELVK